MTASPPDFSVITATWNSATTVAECLESVRSQRNVTLEHIICDGKSTDDTLQIADRHKWSGQTVISERDTGVYDAWNKGIAKSKGQWIVFLGSDDKFHSPTALSEALIHIRKQPDHRLFYGKVRKETHDGQLIGEFGEEYGQEGHLLDPPTLKFPPHPASIFHSSLFDEFPRFDTGFKICADSLHMGRIMRQITPAFVPVTVTCFRTGGLSNSGANALLKWREKFRITRMMGYKIPLRFIAASFAKACVHQVKG